MTRIETENGQWECQLFLYEERQRLVFYSICPVIVSEERRAGVAEFLTRANDGIIQGNFEMNYANGVVRYKTALGLVDLPCPTPEQVMEMVTPNAWMMDHYLPGLLAVVEGRMPPQDAIDLVEIPLTTR